MLLQQKGSPVAFALSAKVAGKHHNVIQVVVAARWEAHVSGWEAWWAEDYAEESEAQVP